MLLFLYAEYIALQFLDDYMQFVTTSRFLQDQCSIMDVSTVAYQHCMFALTPQQISIPICGVHLLTCDRLTAI